MCQQLQIEKIRKFLQNCHEERTITCLEKFRNKKIQEPSLTDDINKTINAIKMCSLLGRTDVASKKTELKKIASRILNESKMRPNNAKSGQSAGARKANNFIPKNNEKPESKSSVPADASTSTGGRQSFNERLKKEKEKGSPPVNIPSAQTDRPTGYTKTDVNKPQSSANPIAGEGSFQNFNQKLKQTSNKGNASSRNNSGCSDFREQTGPKQEIPSLFNYNFNESSAGNKHFPGHSGPPPFNNSFNQGARGNVQGGPYSNVPPTFDTGFSERPGGNNNSSSNQYGRGGRKRGGQSRGNTNTNRGNYSRSSSMQRCPANASVDNIPDLSFGQPRGRKNSNASEASSTMSENPNSRRGQRSSNFSQIEFTRTSSICPLCFESFQARRELATHLKLRCQVVQEGSYKEPDGFSLFQIIDRGIKCNLCKMFLSDNLAEQHKREHHFNDPKLGNVLVNLMFCAICNDFTPLDMIAYHRYTTYHKELVVMREQSPTNKIVLLRRNSYCMLCRNYPPGKIPLEHHISSPRHANNADTPKCDIWCYHCGTSVESYGYKVREHLGANFHKNNAAQDFHCPFCSSDYKLDVFLRHIFSCLNNNSN